MSEFIALISQVLSISLMIGAVNISLGGMALGFIVLRQGYLFFLGLANHNDFSVKRLPYEGGDWDA